MEKSAASRAAGIEAIVHASRARIGRAISEAVGARSSRTGAVAANLSVSFSTGAIDGPKRDGPNRSRCRKWIFSFVLTNTVSIR